MAGPRDLRRAGQAIAETLDAMVEAAPRPSVDERLARIRAERAERAERRAHAERATRGRRTYIAGIAAMAAIAAACLVTYRLARPADLAFQVAGATGKVGERVAAGDADVSLAFSDGTRLDVLPEGRARVVAVNEHGADVLLERGSVRVAVVHREGAAWIVAAGPFEVRVVGTRFEATWDAAAESLAVVMTEGRVEVAGWCLREPRPVSAGESVRLSCREPSLHDGPSVARDAASSQPAAPSPVGTTTPTLASAAPTVAPSVRARDEAAGASSWRERFRQADYPAAFRAAEEQGIEAIAARGSAAEVLELADLARLAKRPDVAQRTYVALRDRFAGSDQAATAAFHLGRMSFSASSGEAERWLSTYLAERPGGPFAAEALGRILEIQSRAGRTDAARQTATRYLASFPEGAHAPLARSIVTP